MRAIFINIMVFIIYLIHLWMNDLSILKVYLQDLPRLHRGKPRETVVTYILDQFSSF
jgi:hypothetical protein